MLGGATVFALAPGCAPARNGFFSDAERRALGGLADSILPPDDDSPGGAALGAVPYIEQLLTAFDSDPPKILAGGPYSGRMPFPTADGQRSSSYPQNDFALFLPLDRTQDRAWRLFLYGSAGVPGGGPNDAVLGKIVGLRSLIRAGLARVMGAASMPLATLGAQGIGSVLESVDLPPGFEDVLFALVTQAAFAAPEYGGNPQLAGWKLIFFQGDSMPLGYSQYDATTGLYRERFEAPLSTPDPGTDPLPLDDTVRAQMELVCLALGGRVRP